MISVDKRTHTPRRYNRKGHYGEDNNIYLNDTNLNNTKDLATTLGHETSHEFCSIGIDYLLDGRGYHA
jgi:hypothetical protein